MSLSSYKSKRNLKKSGEPKAEIKKDSKKLIFVVQKHDASHLHYDFRLEEDGILKSWAIPKEPPKVKGIKRLAVHVEDHPLDYANFSGVIPKGNYGAGTVKIWDKGTYKLEEKKKDKIVFELNGKKLKGKYVLLKTNYGASEEQKKKSWLLMKI